MPVPKPKANESERDFISRCEKFMHEENESKPANEKRSNEQISAICYSAWRKRKNYVPKMCYYYDFTAHSNIYIVKKLDYSVVRKIL